mmetsp:Transcript_10812/g.27335  ORF Transcript_10812/g.27335 Transcript_10812/m.27335 type:complete len:202 (-) Transcript_10812:21-626(-)
MVDAMRGATTKVDSSVSVCHHLLLQQQHLHVPPHAQLAQLLRLRIGRRAMLPVAWTFSRGSASFRWRPVGTTRWLSQPAERCLRGVVTNTASWALTAEPSIPRTHRTRTHKLPSPPSAPLPLPVRLTPALTKSLSSVIHPTALTKSLPSVIHTFVIHTFVIRALPPGPLSPIPASSLRPLWCTCPRRRCTSRVVCATLRRC